MSKKIIGILLLLVLCCGIVLSQQTRDYAITNIDYSIADDLNTVTLQITVTNQGADAVGNAPVVVEDLTTGREITTDTLGPLASGESAALQFELNTADFPPASQQPLQVSVGLDNYELPGSPIASDNVRSITVPIPANLPPPSDEIEPPTLFAIQEETVIIFGREFTRQEAAFTVGAVVGVLLLLWLLTVIFRLLFRRPPRFDTWQPPYSLAPTYDPNSIEGRRQAWQGHAQNSLILGAPSEGNVHPVKMLSGADGSNLGNWKVTAMRLSQYDTYGRIARTQTIAEKSWINRVNKALRNNTEREKIEKTLRPAVKGFVKKFKKNMSSKNDFLPVALDIRLRGKHGDVRIIFELYQFQSSAGWYRIDQWEPVMQVLSETLEENFTYTIHGRSSGESAKEFINRLQQDILWLLTETIEQPQAEPSAENFTVPDTLSGMSPIQEV